jgi:hypothetical protein
MAGDVSLATFRNVLPQRTSWHDAKRCVVLREGQGSPIVAKPVDSPSTWSWLFGKTRLYVAMFGAPKHRETRRVDQLTTLHAFKAALSEAYGPVVAQAAFRSIRSREVLRLSDARAAMEVASKAAKGFEAGNAGKLDEVLGKLRPADFEAQRQPDELSSEQLRELTFARLGPAFSQVSLSTDFIESTLGEMLAMARAGLTNERAEQLLNGLVDLPFKVQRELFEREYQLLKATDRNEQSVLLAMTTIALPPEHKATLPEASRAHASHGDAVFTKALLQAVLAPRPDTGLDDREVDAAARLALSLADSLRRATDVTRPRALEILRFAGAAPRARRQQVVDALCGLQPREGTFDTRGVLTGSDVGQYVRPDFSCRHLLARVGEVLRQNIDQSQTKSFASDTGARYELSRTAHKDAARSDFIIDSAALPKSAEQFPAAFRERFAVGPVGDAAARAVSCCMNQNNINHLVGHVADKAFLPAQKRGFNTLHEATALEGGAWAVRSTFQVTIQAASTAEGEVVMFQHPASAMYCLEYRVTRDLATEARYTVECIGADVVFASSPQSR